MKTFWLVMAGVYGFLIFGMLPLLKVLTAIDWDKVWLFHEIGRVQFHLTPDFARLTQDWERYAPLTPPPEPYRDKWLPHDVTVAIWEADPSQAYWPLLRQIEQEMRESRLLTRDERVAEVLRRHNHE